MVKLRRTSVIATCVITFLMATVPVSLASVPWVDVRIGTDEHPGGHNHMRMQLAVNPSSGTVHMMYRTFGTIPSYDLRTYFYNSYNCGGSDSVDFPDPGIPMSAFVGPPQPRDIGDLGGMLNFPNCKIAPVPYGKRLINQGAGSWISEGTGYMSDGAECLGLFSMGPVVNGNTQFLDPVMYAINETTWVCTLADQSDPTKVHFTYTTDCGVNWTAPSQLNPSAFSTRYNATEITGNGNTFYILTVTVTDFYGSYHETPCYLKGTYNPATGTIALGTLVDITNEYENYEFPCYKANATDISGTMVGDTLHLLWTDWNNYNGFGYFAPGGHIHHASLQPNGKVIPHIIANINIIGIQPGRSTTSIDLATEPWPFVSIAYNPATEILYALWSQPPDNGNSGFADSTNPSIAHLGNYDIFCSASPDHGSSWDDPVNVTQTNNPDCDGSSANPCYSEEHFKAYPRVVNDTLWILALVNAFPGYQTISTDPGPDTRLSDRWRLYKAPARLPVNPIPKRAASCCPNSFDVNIFGLQQASAAKRGTWALFRILFGQRWCPGTDSVMWLPPFQASGSFVERTVSQMAPSSTRPIPEHFDAPVSYNPTNNFWTWHLPEIGVNTGYAVCGWYEIPCPLPTGTDLIQNASVAPYADLFPPWNSRFLTIKTEASFPNCWPSATSPNSDSSINQVLSPLLGQGGIFVLPRGPARLSDTLTYFIIFQNIGTDTARTVVIRDTLDANLDSVTIQTEGSSHTYSFAINGRELSWTLSNANLTASTTNDTTSLGFLVFHVRPKSTATLGTEIKNSALIYFNSNLVVRTDTTSNILCAASKGDMNADANLSPADVVLMLNCVFLTSGNCSLCFSDVNCSNGLSPADVVIELNMVYLSASPPC